MKAKTKTVDTNEINTGAPACTLQDVIAFLRENMRVDVRVGPVPYERRGWTKVEVLVMLGDEVLTQGSDSFFKD